MASTSVNERNSEDKTPAIKQEKLSRNKKTFEEEKVLRKKIRHLHREDERQVRSLTQDLKDIRESLSHVNNIKQVQRFSARNWEGGNHEVKATEKYRHDQMGKCSNRRNASEKSCASSSGQSKLKTASSSQQRKNVTFKDECGERKESERSQKQNETILSLSTIDLE
jgi:Asp-tRNA(Asn)/Glu-tRNA(Gln) amidotransferase C subunit